MTEEQLLDFCNLLKRYTINEDGVIVRKKEEVDTMCELADSEKEGDNMIYEIKDSGKREEMDTGSVRDTQEGKPRYDLVPANVYEKIALHFGKGCEKYGARNWELGQNSTRYMSSAERHFQAFKQGSNDERHLIACIWNLICLDWTLDAIEDGKLDPSLDDRPEHMLPSIIKKHFR